MKSYPRSNILGVEVSAISMANAVEQIDAWIENQTPNSVSLSPGHAIMECYTQPELRRLYNQSGLTTPAGMAIVWILKLRGFHQVERVYGPDLMRRMFSLSRENHYRHYFYGGALGVPEKLILAMQKTYPDLNVVGYESPPFRPLTTEETVAMIKRIKESKADIVWVGIGSPRQEIWMASHLSEIECPVLVGVGAAFDFLSGTKLQAPHWIQKIGFEWLFRLASEPKRLWKRYIQYPKFVLLVLLQSLGLKHFTTTEGVDNVSAILD